MTTMPNMPHDLTAASSQVISSLLTKLWSHQCSLASFLKPLSMFPLGASANTIHFASNCILSDFHYSVF